MRVNIDFAQYIAVIEFEPFLGEKIETYQEAFEEWFYETIQTETGTLTRMRSKFNYQCFDANVVIDWINEVSPESKARIVSYNVNVGDEDTSLPYMYF